MYSGQPGNRHDNTISNTSAHRSPLPTPRTDTLPAAARDRVELRGLGTKKSRLKQQHPRTPLTSLRPGITWRSGTALLSAANPYGRPRCCVSCSLLPEGCQNGGGGRCLLACRGIMPLCGTGPSYPRSWNSQAHRMVSRAEHPGWHCKYRSVLDLA